jgi:hypothetical protein
MDINQSLVVEGITLKCLVCGVDFSICRSCWRGQKYCSKICSKESELIKNRIHQKTYSNSDKGLANGRLRQRRRYKKLKLLNPSH